MGEAKRIPGWKLQKQGKVRDVYVSEDEKRVALVATDRISAFDRTLPTEVPGKGELLTKISMGWCELIDGDLMETDFDNNYASLGSLWTAVDQYPLTKRYRSFLEDPDLRERFTPMHNLQMIPVECIVRGYLTGSGLKSYQETGKVFGLEVPEGLVEASRLESPLYTPTTKAESGHDEPVSFWDTIGIIEKKFPGKGADFAEKICNFSVDLYVQAASFAFERGIIIADTKFEFGVDAGGNLVLADEILTPDSSRFWAVDGYEEGKVQPSFDKQPVRDFLITHPEYRNKPLPDAVITKTQRRYQQAYDMLFGGN